MKLSNKKITKPEEITRKVAAWDEFRDKVLEIFPTQNYMALIQHYVQISFKYGLTKIKK